MNGLSTTTCSGCGNIIMFRFSLSAFFSCPACGKLNSRENISVPDIHSKAPSTASFIRVGTTGAWETHPFEVTGRLYFDFDDDSYVNWWHLEFKAQFSGWLAESYGTMRIMKEVPKMQLPFSALDVLKPGETLHVNGTEKYAMHSSAIVTDCCAEGELPKIREHAKFIWLELNGEAGKGLDVHIYNRSDFTFFRGADVTKEAIQLSKLNTVNGWK
jgi:hypothetical protein